MGENVEPLYEAGVKAVFSIVNRPMDLAEAIDNAEKLYYSSLKKVLNTTKGYLRSNYG